MSPDDERHGTHRGRYAHIRAGQDVCDACREAHNLYERRRRKSQSLYGNKWKVDATGTRRRIQALYRLGWTGMVIAKAIDSDQARIDRIVNHQAHVHAKTAKAVARVYEELSMKLGPSEHNRRIARGKGWLPPLAWDDETINDPHAKPLGAQTDFKFDKKRTEIDPVVVQRFVSGDTYLHTSIAERREIVRLWPRSHAELARLTGWKPERYIDRGDVA